MTSLARAKKSLAIGVFLSIFNTARADGPTPFTSILRTRWQEWSRPGGAITPAQLDHLMRRREIRGEAAAAVAAMKMREKDPNTKQLITWTINGIEEYESLVAQHHSQNSYDKAFQKALALIQADPHTLYARGAPHLSSIHQARNGDCWLLATIGAMIHRDPREVKKLIRNDGDGHYSVHFACHTFVVSAPTDAEIGAYTSDKSDGDWLFVLENAEGQYREHFTHLHRVSEPNDAALVGGSGAMALQHILGRNSDHVDMTPGKPQHELVKKTLTRAFRERRLVLVGTTHDKAITLPHGIARAHCMAVIGWDAAAGKVTIWNPWGNTIEPKGSGPDAGYETVGGVFSMPLHDFTRSFAHLRVENDVPYKPK